MPGGHCVGTVSLQHGPVENEVIADSWIQGREVGKIRVAARQDDGNRPK
jgi:hypothetical protein